MLLKGKGWVLFNLDVRGEFILKPDDRDDKTVAF